MIALPIRYRRSVRALFIQKLQHVVPSVVVLGSGLDHLTHSTYGLGMAEVATSVLVLGSVIRGLRQVRRHTSAAHADERHHHGVDWIDICLSAMLAVEAFAHYRSTGHVPRPTLVLSVTMLVIGVLHPVLAARGARRRELRVGADGISLPEGKFTRLTLTWPQVESINVGDRYATVTATDGRAKRIDLRKVIQPEALCDVLVMARVLLDASRPAANPSLESTGADA